jgi:hypothetical protein
MASGMGVRGTMGRCYGFFADYKDCLVSLLLLDRRSLGFAGRKVSFRKGVNVWSVDKSTNSQHRMMRFFLLL